MLFLGIGLQHELEAAQQQASQQGSVMPDAAGTANSETAANAAAAAANSHRRRAAAAAAVAAATAAAASDESDSELDDDAVEVQLLGSDISMSSDTDVEQQGFSWLERDRGAGKRVTKLTSAARAAVADRGAAAGVHAATTATDVSLIPEQQSVANADTTGEYPEVQSPGRHKRRRTAAATRAARQPAQQQGRVTGRKRKISEVNKSEAHRGSTPVEASTESAVLGAASNSKAAVGRSRGRGRGRGRGI